MVSRLNNLVYAFRELDYFQMGRFSEMLLCKLESEVEGQLQNKNGLLLDEKDIKSALANTLRHILYEATHDMLSTDLKGIYGSDLLAV